MNNLVANNQSCVVIPPFVMKCMKQAFVIIRCIIARDVLHVWYCVGLWKNGYVDIIVTIVKCACSASEGIFEM